MTTQRSLFEDLEDFFRAFLANNEMNPRANKLYRRIVAEIEKLDEEATSTAIPTVETGPGNVPVSETGDQGG